MIFLKSTTGKTYEAEPTDCGYTLFRVDAENERKLLSNCSINIENRTPYPAQISVDKNGIIKAIKHSIPIKFNYAILDFALRSLCLGLLMIGFLGKFDFWVLQIAVIGPVLFYMAVKKREHTMLKWQQSYRLHYEETFELKFEQVKLIFDPKMSNLFFVFTIIQAAIGTSVCWFFLDFGMLNKILLSTVLFFMLLYYSMILCYTGICHKIPLNNLEAAEQKFRTQNIEEIIGELQTGNKKESKIGIISILKFVGIYLLIFHLNEENIEKIARFVISIYSEFQNLFI